MDAREELEGVELYEIDNPNAKRRPSLKLDDLMNDRAHRHPTHKYSKRELEPDSLEFSASRVSLSPDAKEKENSTGTMSTMSTLDGEDVVFSVEPRLS